MYYVYNILRKTLNNTKALNNYSIIKTRITLVYNITRKIATYQLGIGDKPESKGKKLFHAYFICTRMLLLVKCTRHSTKILKFH